MAAHILCCALTLLVMLCRPLEPERLLYVCALSVIAALPGLFAARLMKKDRAAWAVWLSFGNMLPAALPIACITASPEIAAFAVCHHLAQRFIGGWLLRRAGFRIEKNFTLILAYRQTIAHCSRFPDEVHPRENPLFDPARNAGKTLTELLPAAGLLAGLLLTMTGLHAGDGLLYRITAAVLSIPLAVIMLHTYLPLRMPKLRMLPMALLRCLLMSIGMLVLPRIVFSDLFAPVQTQALLICALLPAYALTDDLAQCNAGQHLRGDIADASRWDFIVWIICAAMYFLSI